MKYNLRVTILARRAIKPTSLPRRACTGNAPLSTDLCNKYNVHLIPIRKDDKVLVIHGTIKGKEGKVIQVYHRKWVFHVERITREKANRSTVNVGINQLKLDKDWKSLLAPKAKGRAADMGKGKFTIEDVAAGLPQVD